MYLTRGGNRLIFILLSANFFLGCQAFPLCNETITIKLQLCAFQPGYTNSNTSSTNDPLALYSSVTLYTVSEFNEDDNSVTLSLLLSAWWNEPRIGLIKSFNDTRYELSDADSLEIYSPLMRILNVKMIEGEEKLGPNSNDFYWFTLPHKIEFQKAYRVTIYCSFDFHLFPFDSHDCDFGFGSMQDSTRWLVLKPSWVRDNYRAIVKFGEPPLLVQQSRQPFDIYLESLNPFAIDQEGYNYSYTGMHLKFKRNTLGLLLGGFYVPTGIFALLSLISFSIDIDSVPGRLGSLITLYLIASNTYNSIKAPEGRGFSFLEIWMLGVQAPILLAIFEYFILLALKRSGSNSSRINVKRMMMEYDENQEFNELVRMTDKWTFYGSIGFMATFNITYWTIAYHAT